MPVVMHTREQSQQNVRYPAILVVTIDMEGKQ